MADTIQIKRSATAAVAPASLLPGELAANVADGRLWVGGSGGAPLEIGAGGGAAAATPPAALRAVLDGYALHAWNNPRVSGLYSSPCRITVGSSAGGVPAGFTRAHVFGDTGAPFVSGGGKPVTSGGATSFPCVTPSGSTAVGRHWRVSTVLDGTQLAFHLDSESVAGGGYRFLVDGQYVSLAGTLSGAGADRWYTLQFSNRAKRVVTVEGYGALRFWGAACPDSDTLLNPPDTSLRLIILGDSDLEAYGEVLKGNGPGAVLGDFLGTPDVWAQGVYGTGFVATNGGGSYNYSQRRADWATAAPDMLLFSSSINDPRTGASAQQITDATVAEVVYARSVLPNTPILVSGYSTNLDVAEAAQPGSTALLAQLEQSAAAAIAALNDPYIKYMPVVSAGYPSTSTGAAAGQGNYSLYTNPVTYHATAAGYVAAGLRNAVGAARVCAAMLGAEIPGPLTPKAAAAEAPVLPNLKGGGLIVPMYVYPHNGTTWDPAWEDMIAISRDFGDLMDVLAIVNPNTGPGTAVDVAYARGIRKLQGGKATVIGYVPTGYGARTAAAIKADIDKWMALYPFVEGFFFDEVSTVLTDLPKLTEAVDYARVAIPGGVMAGNPGTWVENAIATTFDVCVEHEVPPWPTDPAFDYEGSPFEVKNNAAGMVLAAPDLHSGMPLLTALFRWVFLSRTGDFSVWDGAALRVAARAVATGAGIPARTNPLPVVSITRKTAPKIAGDTTGAALTTGALTAARQYFVPMVVQRAVTLSGLRISVATAVAGTASVGLYANTTDASGNDGPGVLLTSATGLDTGTTGDKSGAFPATFTLLPGVLYWVSLIGSAGATVRVLPIAARGPELGRLVNNANAITHLYVAGSGSTLPSTANATQTNGTGNTPAVYLLEV